MSKGRNKDLVTERDRRMFERYYYWTEVCRLRFDDAIRRLSREEFFISEARVLQIVRRMVQEGYTVDGKGIDRPLFTGFRSAPKKQRSKKQCEEVQTPLFPGLFD